MLKHSDRPKDAAIDQKQPAALRLPLARPSNSVALLVRATSPACTALLVEKLPAAITVDQCNVIWL